MIKGLTPTGKNVLKGILIAILIAVGYFGVDKWNKRSRDVDSSKIIGQVALPDAPEASLSGNATKLNLPSSTPSVNGGTQIEWKVMAWQSQNGLMYANGGARTTKGSLIDAASLDISIIRQDNCTQSCTDMVKFINDYKENPQTKGLFITFMGSGIPAYITSISNAVKDLGPEYQPVAFLTFGKSYGEDQVIGDIKYKNNPQLLEGAVCRGVRMDGDNDLIIKFSGDNGRKVNSNEKLYYPDALNLSYAADFLSAVNDYNSNLKETRTIVRNGKTGKDTTIGIDLVATWTPGDVNAINGRGGVTIISTKQYASMMPNITITCKKWLNDHRSDAEKLTIALAQAGDQIRSFDEAKRFACKLNAEVYKEQNESYWYKYYNGVKHDENTTLGGSMVFNLADMANIFGLGDQKNDIYRAVYTTFGDLQSKLYPNDLATYLPYQQAVDKSILMSVISNYPDLMKGKALKTEYATNVTQKVSSKSIQIQFETASAVIKSESFDDLDEIFRSATVAEGLKLAIYGHTDNTGNDILNRELSERRAKAVRDYMLDKGLSEVRIEYKGYGSSQPIASNSTAEGKAQNRRVEIILGQ